MTRAKPKPPIPTRDLPRGATRPSAKAGAAAVPSAKGKPQLTALPTSGKVPARVTTPKTIERKRALPKAPVSRASKAKPVPSVKAPIAAARKGKAATPTPVAGTGAKITRAQRGASAGKAQPVPVDTKVKLRPIEQAVGVSSDAVLRRTGKSWAEWFALLDAAGAATLDHKGIVAVLAQRHGVGPWWQQMVTVAYEQARGKNGKQASDEGFQVDVVKTLQLPLAKLFRFWAEPSERNKWLADDRFSIHKATASKSIRARWGRGSSRIDVDFCEKGPQESQVTVQHNRIETSDAAEQMKAYWAKKINALEALLRPTTI